MSAPETVTAFAPAKLNLTLHVVGRRADGLHLLDSLVAFADIGDTVTVTPARALELTVEGPFAAALAGEGDNLVTRAAVRLAVALGRAPQVAIRLTKRLPVASGIGGGSSDAAATLRCLLRLWDLSPTLPEAAEVAAGLGADVPVCLAARGCRVSGIGEVLSPLPPLPAAPLLLANPGIALPTPAVFKARRGPFGEALPTEAPRDGVAALARWLAGGRNDLTTAAEGLVPEIRTVLEALRALPGCLIARMSGSGATCFALFASASAAADGARVLAAAQPGWWVAAGRLAGPDLAEAR